MCRDERHVLLKMNVAPLLELSRKFWMIWNGHSRRKVTRLTMMFKMISGLWAIQPRRYILFKRRRGTGQFHSEKFIQVSAKTNKCQHSFIARTIRDWYSLPNCVIESSQWRFSKWPSCASFKTMNREHFIIIIIHLTLAPWLYVKISTSTFAHLPWWDIPFADNAIRIRIRMCCGVPGWQMLWVNDQVSKIYFCVRGTRTQPLIFVGCSVHYWVSCAIKKGGFFDIACVVVVDTHLPRFEALAYVLPHFDALTHVVIHVSSAFILQTFAEVCYSVFVNRSSFKSVLNLGKAYIFKSLLKVYYPSVFAESFKTFIFQKFAESLHPE